MRLSTLSSTVGSFLPQRLHHKMIRVMLILAVGSTLWPATLWPATPVSADAPTFFLPYGTPVFEIPVADLLAAVPGATGQVLSNTPPEHGPLFNLGAVYQYQTSKAFFEQGLDSFHYQVTVGTTNVWTTAFLVAGMRGDGFFSMSLDDPQTEMDSVDVYNQDNLSINSITPINGSHDLQFELDGPPAFVQPKGDDTVAGNGSLGSGLDDGGSGPDLISAEMVIATAFDSGNTDVVRVLIVDGLNGPELAAEIRSDSSSVFTRTQGVAVEGGDHWTFQWWTAAANGSRDGGALLWINGVVEDILSGLDNTNLNFTGWRFGAIDPTDYSGVFRLDDMVAERGLSVPRPLPVFSDNFEAAAPIWSGESCGSESLAVAPTGALIAPLDSGAINCFRSKQFTESQRQHRVRIRINFKDAMLVPGNRVSLVRGRRSGDLLAQLQLRVRQTVTGVRQVRADADLNDGSQVNLDWVDLPAGDQHTLEMHWWAADADASDGGLRLVVNGQPQGQVLGLDNSDMTVDELRLGVLGVAPASSGSLAFEAVEAWR